jgi:hypothetical protein
MFLERVAWQRITGASGVGMARSARTFTLSWWDCTKRRLLANFHCVNVCKSWVIVVDEPIFQSYQLKRIYPKDGFAIDFRDLLRVLSIFEGLNAG